MINLPCNNSERRMAATGHSIPIAGSRRTSVPMPKAEVEKLTKSHAGRLFRVPASAALAPSGWSNASLGMDRAWASDQKSCAAPNPSELIVNSTKFQPIRFSIAQHICT